MDIHQDEYINEGGGRWRCRACDTCDEEKVPALIVIGSRINAISSTTCRRWGGIDCRYCNGASLAWSPASPSEVVSLGCYRRVTLVLTIINNIAVNHLILIGTMEWSTHWQGGWGAHFSGSPFGVSCSLVRTTWYGDPRNPGDITHLPQLIEGILSKICN